MKEPCPPLVASSLSTFSVFCLCPIPLTQISATGELGPTTVALLRGAPPYGGGGAGAESEASGKEQSAACGLAVGLRGRRRGVRGLRAVAHAER